MNDGDVMSFEARIAALWQKILLSNQKQIFEGAEKFAIDRPHGYDRLAQPGFVGHHYEPGGILLLAANPANGDSNGESLPDLRQYEILLRLRNATSPDRRTQASKELMLSLASAVMPTWKIVQNVVLPILDALNLKLDDVAYTNLVKFRTSESKLPSSIYSKSWHTTASQLDLLQPSFIVALGRGTYDEFLRYYKGLAKHDSVERRRGDYYLPENGRLDIERIAKRLISGST